MGTSDSDPLGGACSWCSFFRKGRGGDGVVLKARDFWVFGALVERVVVAVRVVLEELLSCEVSLPVGLWLYLVSTVGESLCLCVEGSRGIRGQALDKEVMFASEVGSTQQVVLH